MRYFISELPCRVEGRERTAELYYCVPRVFLIKFHMIVHGRDGTDIVVL